MNIYLWIKTIHILSSVLLVGTGFGSAFYLFFANRSGNVQAQAVVARLVVRADWWFTTPTVVLQPVTGLLMVYMTGWSLASPWLLLTLVLYAVAGLCWLPVVWIQLRMAAIVKTAAAQGDDTLPPLYWRYARWWESLGYPAFIAMLAVFYLMVTKPMDWAGVLPF